MKNFRFSLNVLAVALFTLAFASLVQAQATRTWVSGVGDDVNPCSRTAPCKTFAGAISKTAAAGEISVLDPAGFGTINITKSITIDGGGIQGSILSAGTTAVIVNAGATDKVYIRNLNINGAGTGTFGIRYLAGGELSIDNVSIIGMTNHGISVSLTGAVTGRLYVNDTYIRTGNSTTSRGISIEPASGSPTVHATINNVRAERMSVGLFAGEGSQVNVRNSTFTQNVNSGIQAQAASGNATVNVESCMVSGNGLGVTAGTGATTVRISNTTVYNNSVQGVFPNGGTIISFGNNSVAGNGMDGNPSVTIMQR